MMGNLAAQKFELQARVAPSGKKILAICFWVRNILPGDLIRLLTQMAKDKILACFLATEVIFLARGLIFSEFRRNQNFMGQPKKSSRSDHPMPSNLLKTISPL